MGAHGASGVSEGKEGGSAGAGWNGEEVTLPPSPLSRGAEQAGRVVGVSVLVDGDV